MVYLTGENRIITSRELEKALNIPQQSIFGAGRKLKKFGFVKTVSGPFGGYVLAKPPESITVQDILSAFKDEFNIGSEKKDSQQLGMTAVFGKSKKAQSKTLQNFSEKLINVKKEVDRQMSFTLADLLA